MKIGCKIKSVVGVNFKKLLIKIVNLIFKYILNRYFIECDWRCSNHIRVLGSIIIILPNPQYLKLNIRFL